MKAVVKEGIMRSPRRIQRSFPAAVCFLVSFGVSLPANARDVQVPEPLLDAAAAKEFPQAQFEKITEKITYLTTFIQITPNGVVRWRPRTPELFEFVKSPSKTDRDTYLYAMRYEVSVLNSRDATAVFDTSCQVVVVYKDGGYDEPTVVCEPIILNRKWTPNRRRGEDWKEPQRNGKASFQPLF